MKHKLFEYFTDTNLIFDKILFFFKKFYVTQNNLILRIKVIELTIKFIIYSMSLSLFNLVLVVCQIELTLFVK